MLQLTFAKCRRSYSSTSPDKTIIARLSDDDLEVAEQLAVEVAGLGVVVSCAAVYSINHTSVLFLGGSNAEGFC